MQKSAVKYCASTNPEIGSNGGVVFGLTLFFLGVYIPHLGFMMNAGGKCIISYKLIKWVWNN
jgi:hypothetical protein